MGRRDRSNCKECGSSDPATFDPKHRLCTDCKPFDRCRRCGREYTDKDDGHYAACETCRTDSQGGVRTKCGCCNTYTRQYYDGATHLCYLCVWGLAAETNSKEVKGNKGKVGPDLADERGIGDTAPHPGKASKKRPAPAEVESEDMEPQRGSEEAADVGGQISNGLRAKKTRQDREEVGSDGEDSATPAKKGRNGRKNVVASEAVARHGAGTGSGKAAKKPRKSPVARESSSELAPGTVNEGVVAVPNGARVFPCEIEGCDLTFATTDQRRYHHKSFHREEYEQLKKARQQWEFKCPVNGCGKAYKSVLRLQSHQRVGHRPSYECGFCGKDFKSFASLRNHKRVKAHGDIPREEKSFKCPVDGCGRTYGHVDSLRKHKRVDHKLPDARREGWQSKAFICTVPGCHGSGYSTRKALNLHTRNKHPGILNAIETRAADDMQDVSSKGRNALKTPRAAKPHATTSGDVPAGKEKKHESARKKRSQVSKKETVEM